MRDRLLLLGTGLITALLSWAFFHYLGNDAWLVWFATMWLAYVFQNRHLRKEIERLKKKADEG